MLNVVSESEERPRVLATCLHTSRYEGRLSGNALRDII